MTTYSAIANGSIDQDSPVTQPIMTALRDNPLAIQEGDSTAPRVKGKALGDMVIGTIETSGTTAVGLTGLDDHSVIICLGALFVKLAGGQLETRYTDDNGSSWGSWQTTSTGTVADNIFASVHLNLETGVFLTRESTSQNTGTHTVPSNCNGFQFRFAVATSTPRVEMECFAMGGIGG